MPDFCAAYGCSNERNILTRSRGITFHRFPKDSSLKREWELAVKREGFVATERSLLCSEHFKADDFDRTGQTVRLRHGVKPSVFNFPSHLQKQLPSRTTQALRKAVESLPVDLPQHFHEVDPQSNVANGRLELEASHTQDPGNGGGTANVKKPVALTKAPIIGPKARYDTSLSLLTRGFAELLQSSSDGVMDLNVVARALNTPKRRVYDVTNVLEGIKLIKKTSKNHIEWLGERTQGLLNQEIKVLIEKENKLDELISICTQHIEQLWVNEQSQRFAYLTHDDVQRIHSFKEQTLIVIKAPTETKLEVPHPEESLQIHLSSTTGPIDVFLCSDDPIPIEATEDCVSNHSHINSSTSGNNSGPLSPSLSFHMYSKDSANYTSGINNVISPLTHSTKHPSASTVTPVSHMSTSLQRSTEDQQSFVTLNPPMNSSDGGEYLPNLAEDEGVSDFFSDLGQMSMDISV